jgi:hypothetical protein
MQIRIADDKHVLQRQRQQTGYAIRDFVTDCVSCLLRFLPSILIRLFVEIADRDKTKIVASTPFLRLPIMTRVSASLDLLPFTGPVESSASGILTCTQILSRLKVEYQAFLTCTQILSRLKVEYQAF